MFFVYILSSNLSKRYYIGVSQNIEKRLYQHNMGRTKSTKPYRPWRVIHIESFEVKTDAYRREYFLKHPEGFLEKKRIIENLK